MPRGRFVERGYAFVGWEMGGGWDGEFGGLVWVLGGSL